MTDRVLKGIGGFFYVDTPQGVIECKPKGIFRKRGLSPLPGDFVRLENFDGSWVIAEIGERKNCFVRPPAANVDVFFLIASTVEPVPSTLVLDQLAAVAVEKGARPILIVTKTDLKNAQELEKAYAHSGLPLIRANAADGEGVEEIRSLIRGNVCVFCGNSGVGKSTLLNAVVPALSQQTDTISKKLGRGRHTTRQVEFFAAEGGLVADTPGFSSIDMERLDRISKENLQYDFPEMRPYLLQCRFTGCSHTCEKGCAVREAVQNGKIDESRYQSYVTMYEQAKEWKEWEK